jgi:hypothetical protein
MRIFLVGLLLAFVQQPTKAPLSFTEIQQFREDIQSGRRVLEAGRTGDQRLVPFLKKRLDSVPADSPLRHDAIAALAKLGDKESLSIVDSKLKSQDPWLWVEAAQRDLRYIGGWFAISRYRMLLDANAQFEKLPRRKEPPSTDDVVIGGAPRSWALRYLPDIIPNAPFRWVRGASLLKKPSKPSIGRNSSRLIRSS